MRLFMIGKKENQVVWSRETKMLVTAILVIAGVLALWFADTASFLGFISQWIIAIMSMVIIGSLIRDTNSLNGDYGLYLLSTTRGIGFIDRISKMNQEFWEGMSVWGIVLGFGLLSYPFLKGRISKKLMALGILSIVVVMLVIYPYLLVGFQFINISAIQSALQSAQQASSSSAASSAGTSIIVYALYAVALVAGLVGFVFVALLENSIVTLIKIATFLQTVVVGAPQTSTLSGLVPGVAPLIPGIDIPLLAGLISLAILLVPHEFSHGILSRIARVRIKSVGLVLIGIIPIGAFVEPDEKQVSRLEDMKQTRLLAAGTSANFIMMFIFFVLLFVTATYVMPHFFANEVVIEGTVQGEPAYGVLQPGMQVLQWNSVHINNMSNLEQAAGNDTPGSLVTLVTNNGTYTFRAISINDSVRGYIGVEVGAVYAPVNNGPAPQIVNFLYSLFALSLLFNFSLAVMNLLPLPFFDGWRLFMVNIRNKAAVRAITALVVVLILMNLVGWLFIPLSH